MYNFPLYLVNIISSALVFVVMATLHALRVAMRLFFKYLNSQVEEPAVQQMLA